MKTRMRISFYLCVLISIMCVLMLSSNQREEFMEENLPLQEILHRYDGHLHNLIQEVEEMKSLVKSIDQSSMKTRFLQARLTYKKIEWLVEYRYRESALKINGPNLLEAEISQPNIPIYPSGFQVLEEAVFAEPYQRSKVQFQLDGLIGALKRVQKLPIGYLSASEIVYAHKLNLYRLISKGLVHFDTPIAEAGLLEAPVALLSLKQDLVSLEASTDLVQLINQSMAFIKANVAQTNFPYFDLFNRYLNPLCDQVVDLQLAFQKRDNTAPFQHSAIRNEAGSMFAPNAFDPFYFAPSDALLLDSQIVRIGEQLFRDKRLSADGKRACISCHKPELSFTDGLKVNQSIASSPLLRNTPTLWNAAYQNNQFADSRIVYLEDQIHAVVTNKDEMDGTFSQIVQTLNKIKDYRSEFDRLFGKKGLTERNLKRVLAAYMRSLSAFDSKFDQAMRNPTEGDENLKVGFDLFMGKGKCGTCHFVPLFNGSSSPYFDKIESEVLGVPQSKNKPSIVDPDLGKYNLYHIPHQKHAFKTVSLRKVGHTAPYMHNGVFSTLYEVMDFYNNGGGTGYAIDLENQTLSPDSLHLTEGEIQQIISFLESL